MSLNQFTKRIVIALLSALGIVIAAIIIGGFFYEVGLALIWIATISGAVICYVLYEKFRCPYCESRLIAIDSLHIHVPDFCPSCGKEIDGDKIYPLDE